MNPVLEATNIRKKPIGVVIPCYGHPQFLSEAIESACRQEIDRDVYVVVVNDGCRFPSSEQATVNLLQAHGGKLFALRQANTGLPGARNTGVRFLLNMLPDLDSIFFLDADNYLDSHALAAYRQALGDDPATGWAYPDITFFGLTWAMEGHDIRETAPVYSKLRHLMGNICEAGSLVRADVFRNGVFYDEDMRYGLEDWDFWLSALEAGYVGARVQDAGFNYRRRPESMLAGTRRLENDLIFKMRQTHESLFNIKAIRQLEHQEAPCFAIVLVDEDKVILTSDTQADGRELTLQEFGTMCLVWLRADREIFFPECFLFLKGAQWQGIKAMGQYSRWLVWTARLHSQSGAFVQISEGSFADCRITPWCDADQKNSGFRVMGARGFRQLMVNRGERAKGVPQVPIVSVAFSINDVPAGLKKAGPSDKDICKLIERLPEPQPLIGHMTRSYSGPLCNTVRDQLINPICGFEGTVPFPVGHGSSRAILAFAQHDMAEAGHRDLIEDIVSYLRGLEVEITVLVAHDGQAAWQEPAWMQELTDIVPIYVKELPARHAYLGSSLQMVFEPWQINQIVTIARSVDYIFVLGGSVFLEAAGPAKGKHAKLAVVAPKDAELQNIKLLAFEHAENVLLVECQADGDRLKAMGVPADKIYPVTGLVDAVGASLEAKQ